MMFDFFNNLASGIQAKIESDPQSVSGRKLYALETARLGARLYSGKEKIAWCGVTAPFDLLNAMDVTSCFVEFVGAMLASTGGVEPIIQLAEENGYASDCCSYHRAVYGATIQDIMPKPDFLVATSAICSAGLASIESLARIYKKDLFVVHVPLGNKPEAVAYLAEQYRELSDFVGNQIGRPLDPQRLRQATEMTNQARALMIEVYDLAKSVPTPARRKDLVNFGIVMALFLGTPAAVRIAEVYRDEFAAKVKAKTQGVKNEKIRLLWLQNRIQFSNPLEQMLEDEFQAAVVADELNDIFWEALDPDDPFPGLARRTLGAPMCGPAEQRIEGLVRLAREYQVDGAINPCHWGCRQGTGGRGLVEAGLREIGIPTLNLEVDCVDPRNYAEGQLKTRLEAFIETITQRKQAARV
jgi:benzoyl-CoA reductase/2-hydroxyglutaryl-CoA dehydratase subunit BcrC/BadD/HgdB